MVESGESLQEALKREIKEESGVDVEIIGFVGLCITNSNVIIRSKRQLSAPIKKNTTLQVILLDVVSTYF
jgi:8-oxo-dGTP pyrophosphatase MutT (NUDIX family)